MVLLLLTTRAVACEPITLQTVMNLVDAAIGEGRATDGLDHLEAIWQRIPTACPPLPAAELALIAQRAGALAWDLERAERSDEWFESACRVAPTLIVPASLGPTAAAHGRAACERVGGRANGQVVVESPVVLDGTPREVGARLILPIGVHVLAWQEGGVWQGRWQTVDDVSPIALPSGNLTVIPSPTPPPSIVTAPEPDAPAQVEHRRVGLPVALVGTGAVLSGAGAAALQLLFANRWNQDCVGQGISYADQGWKACEDQLGVPLSAGYYGGIGLIAGGAAVGLTGVGLGVHAFVDTSGPGLRLTLPL